MPRNNKLYQLSVSNQSQQSMAGYKLAAAQLNQSRAQAVRIVGELIGLGLIDIKAAYIKMLQNSND